MPAAQRRIATVALLLTLVGATCAYALDPETAAARFTVASWTEKDGLSPGVINAIAQDQSGYLWLGTNAGLLRFDGVRFVRWGPLLGPAFPSVGISSLAAGKDGSLWIGFRGVGGVSRLKDGRVTTFRPEDGVGEGAVSDILVDHAGTIWAASLRGLARFRVDRWERLGAANGLPFDRMHALHEDRDQRVWVATSNEVFRSAADGRFVLVRTKCSVRSFAEDTAGTIWATTNESALIALSDASGASPSFNPGNTTVGESQMLRDRDDNIWIAARRAGLLRVSPRNRSAGRIISAERLTGLDGLSNDTVLSVFEDREGNLWVGTQRGLNRLSNSIITLVPGRGDSSVRGRLRAVETAEDVLWFGTDDGLYQFRGDKIRRFDATDGLPGVSVTSLHTDPSGTLWAATERGVARLEGERFVPIDIPGPAFDTIRSFLIDPAGHFWLSDITRGTFRWKTSDVNSVNLTTKIALSARTDAGGNVWMGFQDGTVEHHDAGGVHVYSREEGLVGDRACALYIDHQGRVWVGTNGGLSRFTQGRFVTLTSANGMPLDNVTAIVGDDDGYLWLGVGTGIARIRIDEFDRFAADSAYRVNFNLYGPNDGVPGTPLAIGFPAAARAADGTLWFLTNNGLAAVKPRGLGSRKTPLAVTIEGVTADRLPSQIASTQRSLPARTSNVQIDYTALSFTAPAQIHFRYRMDGFDQEWIDAGTRRQAFYTNLPPRAYRFQVMATSDGAWTNPATVWEFSIQPTWYQTYWFYAGCVLLLGIAVYGGWQVRAFQLRHRFAIVLSERMRIGRELHDTLLQSLVGVGMQFEDVLRKLESSPAAARAQLERLDHQVKFYVREARQSVWDLRSPLLETSDLQTALQEVGERITSDHPARFEFQVRGTPRRCATKRHEEQLLRISQEALSNAVRHAEATQIRMEINYSDEAITLRIVDDGRGFDVSAPNGRQSNHWGLASMRERAQQAGADFRLTSRPGEGTVIEVIAA